MQRALLQWPGKYGAGLVKRRFFAYAADEGEFGGKLDRYAKWLYTKRIGTAYSWWLLKYTIWH